MSELQGLQSRIDDFRAAGARVIAVSPDTVEKNREVVEKLGLAFSVLSDAALTATDAFGVRHPGGFGSVDIPRPATFIVEDGVVRWRSLTDNWRIRVRPEPILAALAALDAPGA